MSHGIYISVPFCRTKCTFCNFASGVSSAAVFEDYVAQVGEEIDGAQTLAQQLGGDFSPGVDSIYLGGGTPSVLAPGQLARLFDAVRKAFDVVDSAEITVECAPGTISDHLLESLIRSGVNRVSLGVQSFVDQECSAVGRLHKRSTTLSDIARLRSAGIENVAIDLIAGLPHQTEDSWNFSLSETVATGVPHVSVYMLEVDEDSRLGTELLAGGNRYHAHHVPDEDLIADLYLAACECLDKAGVRQYEISNFARPATHGIGLRESRHNSKYWLRQPYFGFGVDAHSMLPANASLRETGIEAVRSATPDSLEAYSQARQGDPGRAQQLADARILINTQAAIEEEFFLGMRLLRGVSLESLKGRYGAVVDGYSPVIEELASGGLLEQSGAIIKLTPRGRLLSNEVFARFLQEPVRQTTADQGN